jgi:hypothetical protein
MNLQNSQNLGFFFAYISAEQPQASIRTTGCLDGVHLKMEWYAPITNPKDNEA